MSDREVPSASAEEFERKRLRFLMWNGDGSPPQFSHWTNQGSVIVRAATPSVSSVVIWKPKDGDERHLGYDDIFPYGPMRHITEGKYDQDAGVELSKIVPPDPIDWNNLA